MFWPGRMSGRPIGAAFSTVEASFAQVIHISVHKTEAKLVDNRVAILPAFWYTLRMKKMFKFWKPWSHSCRYSLF